MTPPKKQPKGFSSLRIIGRKAQKLIESAKRAAQTPAQRTGQPARLARDKQQETVMHISVPSVTKAALAILAIAAGTWFVFHVRSKIILLLLAMFVAAVIDPGVQALGRFGVPRAIAVLLHYVAALLLVGFLLVSLIPIIAQQLQEIGLLFSIKIDTFLSKPEIDLPLISDQANAQLTVFAKTTLENLSIDRFTDALQQMGRNLSSTAQQSVRYAAALAGSVATFFASTVIVLVLAFFMQLEKERLLRWVLSFFPAGSRSYVNAKTEAVHSKISQWARGQLLLCFSIFLLTLTALLILDVDYALTLALFAGFCEFIPAVGPFIAAIPAVLIGGTKGGLIWALIMAGIYYVIQWCENNLLVPLIMKRAVGLSPIAILFAMMIGISFPDTVHPVLGIILAIPTTTIIAIFLEDFRSGGSA